MFYIGQKVVCIKGFEDVASIYPFIVYPVKDAIYTVSSIDVTHFGQPLRFEEIRNMTYDVGYGPQEPSFYRGRFRPVVEPKTDISIFTDMLVPSDDLVPA